MKLFKLGKDPLFYRYKIKIRKHLPGNFKLMFYLNVSGRWSFVFNRFLAILITLTFVFGLTAQV